MSYKNKAKQISDMWVEIAENGGAYFEFLGTMGWEKQNKAPNMASLLDRWRVNNPQRKWVNEVVGDYTVKNGDVERHLQPSTDRDILRGFTRKTYEQAELLAKDTIALARLSARVDELGGRAEFIEGEKNWFIKHLSFNYMYVYSREEVCIGAIYMTRECAKQVCKELNSGYLEMII